MAFRTMWKDETAATPWTITVSGVTAHDVLVMAVVNDQNLAGVTFTWPAGFVEVGTQFTSADGGTIGVAIKADASGTEGALTVTPSGGNGLIGAVYAFSGRDNTNTQDFTADVVNNNTAQASAWSITTGAAVTTGHNDCDIIAIYDSDVTASVGGAVAHSFATATGTTGAWTSATDVSDGGFRQIGLGYANQVTAGALTVTGTGTAAGKSAGRAMFTVGLRSANSPTAQIPLLPMLGVG